jgi:hypothetical protein
VEGGGVNFTPKYCHVIYGGPKKIIYGSVAVHWQLGFVTVECNVLHTEASRLQLVPTLTEFYLQQNKHKDQRHLMFSRQYIFTLGSSQSSS